ncbi:MAG: DUF177 domain-containing protein [Pseudomonadota bacterium]|nr:DUF177 domain-containing protein [Pseudomonadota bacterium]
MKINLNEIPVEGREYICNQRTGEFSESLADLVRQEPYTVHFLVRPIGNIFEVTGNIKTQLNLTCARCAADFKSTLDLKLNELLVPGEKLPRTGKEAKVNHISELDDDGPTTSIFESFSFDMNPLIRDTVALSEPTIAFCKIECKGLCQYCGQDLNAVTCNCDVEHQMRASPLAKLAEIKLN